MLRGSSCLAYGVGMGKTWCSIFTIAQNLELGFCKRPLIVVPNQVYPQFVKEISLLLPQYKVNELYNARGYYDDRANNITDNSISIITYEGMEALTFSENLDFEMLDKITNIISQGNENLTNRQRAKQKEKFEGILGKAKVGANIEFDSPNVNFDYLAIDEAHNFKKVFTQVKGEAKEKQGETSRITYEKTNYDISSGTQSTRAIKLFFLTQYIQNKSVNGNCLLLTATPFTNSPLEVYSILTLINYKYLKEIGLGNLKEFFDNYAQVSTDVVINTQLEPVRKQVFSGFNNLVSLQSLIFKFIDKPTKAQEEQNVQRPNKIILPLSHKNIDGHNFEIPEQNRVSTTIQLTDDQLNLWADLKSYAKGELTFNDIANDGTYNLTTCGKLNIAKNVSKDENDIEVVESSVITETDDKEQGAGVRALQCLTYARQLALSPYLYRYSGIKEEPTYTEYVEASPKLSYTVECIKSVKEHHEKTNTPMSGQVIYMDIGTECFHYIVEYFIKEVGFKENEVGYITGTKSVIGNKKEDKNKVQDAFLGREWSESEQKFVNTPHENRLKVLIGSSAIKEGINLQNYATVLYNLYMDFNPTDMVQLEGRIWRQGNEFNNVRIVVPLMENSMDIFMFQKLQEKTQRINQIWTRNGVNELDLSDFNPEELKYELITDPKTLAELTLDGDKAKIDEQISEINYDLTSLKKVGDIYEDYDSFYKDDTFSSTNVFKYMRLGQLYELIRTIRPSLLNKKLINNNNDNTDLTLIEQNNGLLFSPNKLNYTPQELFEIYVQVKKDGKVEYPIGYDPNFLSSVDENLKVGDKVVFRRRGEGFVDAEIVLADSPYFDLKTKDGEVFKDLHLRGSEISKIMPTSNLELEPLNIGSSKKFISEISNINKFQKLSQENRLKGSFSKYNIGSRTGTLEDKNLSLDSGIESPTIFEVLNLNYMSDTEVVEYFSKIKANTFFERVQSQYCDTHLGYQTRLPCWSNEYPLMMKKIKRTEDEFLKPLGIENKKDLSNKILFYDGEIKKLEDKKSQINSPEYLLQKINEVRKEIALKKAEGIRKASTYTQRAFEFANTNEDYQGNLLLDSLQGSKEKSKEDEEEVKEIVEVSEKNENDIVLMRIQGLEMVVEDQKDMKAKKILEKRILALKMLIE